MEKYTQIVLNFVAISRERERERNRELEPIRFKVQFTLDTGING